MTNGILSTEWVALISYFTISVGVPIHIFFTFKILDLFMVAIKVPAVVIEKEFPESGQNSISFFASNQNPSFPASSVGGENDF